MRIMNNTNRNTLQISSFSIMSLALLVVFLPLTGFSQEADALRKENQLLKEQLKRMDELEMRLAELEGDQEKVQEKWAPETISDTTDSQMLVIPDAELREPHQVLTGNELVEESFPASWPMFGSEFRMKIGGLISLKGSVRWSSPSRD